jgi:hypothetical protein
MLGRDPHQETYAPSKSSGDFESFYSITARMPKTRTFAVGANGSVALKVTANSDYESIKGGLVTVILHREQPWYTRDDSIEPTQQLKIGEAASFVWSGLEPGTYYFEIYQLSGMLVEGQVAVQIRP